MRITFSYIQSCANTQWHATGRPVIFHHIPRSGGTTLLNLLHLAADQAKRSLHLLTGTIYGQFLGLGKADAIEQIDALKLSTEDVVAGHVPWGSVDTPLPNILTLTALRNPADRLLSHYKLGMLRGGWDSETPIETLYAEGLITANIATQMLAGSPGADRSVDEEALQLAKDHLSAMSLAADTAKLDVFCGHVLGAFGCPAVMIFQGNPTELDLETGKREELESASARFDSFDWLLYDSIKAKLLANGEDVSLEVLGDDRSFFILLMPIKGTPGGIEAVRVEKARLPQMEERLKAKFSGYEVRVVMPDCLRCGATS